MNTCFGCGEDNPRGLQLGPLARIEDGEIRIDLKVPKDFEGFEEIVHGGIVATMLDEAMGFTVTRIHQARGAVTANLNLEFKGPVKTDTTVQVRARSVREGRRFDCSAELLDTEGRVLAGATSLWIIPSDGGPASSSNV